MPRKYFAQILLKVELVNGNTSIEAQEELDDILNRRYERYFRRAQILNAHIIQSPSDEEFLESLCIK